MSRYAFELATRADDAELRRVFAETPMGGDISVSFRREPSYFDAAVVSGEFCQTVIGRDSKQQQIVGCGARSVRQMFVNGQRTPIGYLSGLRLLPTYRSLGLVARGYAYFRALHADGRARLYLTTVAEGNDAAISTITSGRAGLPPYHFAGKYFTFVLPVGSANRNGQNGHDSGVTLRAAELSDLSDILAFLNEIGPRRQFFPCYAADDFFDEHATFRNLKTKDLLLAYRDGQIVGTFAAWDQRAFRQSVVERYSTLWRWMRPVYNGWAHVAHRPTLPAVGEPFDYVIGALPVVADDDSTVLASLLEAARRRAAEMNAGHLLVGLHEDDPLLDVVKSQGVTSYTTRMYYVCWEDGDALRQSLDRRVPYLELGAL